MRIEHADVLKNAVSDGRSIASALKERGFDVMTGYDLDRRSMNCLIDDFIAQLSSGTIAIVFYAGHGVQVAGGNYLIPIDLNKPQRENDLVNDGIDLGRLVARMSEANDSFNLAIVDACRDNPFRVSGRSLGGRRGLAPTTATGR